MGSFHLLHSKNKKDNQPFQTHGCRYCIQKHKHNNTNLQNQNHIQEHNKSGIYALTCNMCKQAYIRQTNRHLKQRYQEHISYIRNNNRQSAYAQHILKNQHEYGPMNDTMTLLKYSYEQKTPMLILYEQLYIHTYHKNGLLIPEQHTGDINPLFQLIINTVTTNTHKH